jgi:hypothetical protein
MIDKSVFKVDKCQDCWRITRIDVSGDLHCHCKSRKLVDTIITNVCNGKIPLHSHTRTLECMARLSTDEKYIHKLTQVITHRKHKGKKQEYLNVGTKSTIRRKEK